MDFIRARGITVRILAGPEHKSQEQVFSITEVCGENPAAKPGCGAKIQLSNADIFFKDIYHPMSNTVIGRSLHFLCPCCNLENNISFTDVPEEHHTIFENKKTVLRNQALVTATTLLQAGHQEFLKELGIDLQALQEGSLEGFEAM